MPSAEARIPTDRATRYLEQLCSHLGAMGHVRHVPASGHSGPGGGHGVPRVEDIERSRDRAVIRFADGYWDLAADAEGLVLRVEADTDAALERLTTAIAARIAKIGRRDGLSVTWSPPTVPGDGRVGHDGHDTGTGTGSARQPGRPGRRWRTVGWFALAGVAVAIHAGLIGSLLGGGRWRDASADTVIALIAAKLVLLALHRRHGKRRSHRTPRDGAPGLAGEQPAPDTAAPPVVRSVT